MVDEHVCIDCLVVVMHKLARSFLDGLNMSKTVYQTSSKLAENIETVARFEF